MFHHFHDSDKHKKFQGSISKNDFIKIIKFVGRKNILDADEFINRLSENKLRKEVCITFDDGLMSQFDVALPILQDLNIKAFFFPHTAIFGNKPDYLEIYRYFRVNFFKNINEFYKSFFKNTKLDINKIFTTNDLKNEILRIKSKAPFYSLNDIKFRILRNNIISSKQYHLIMMHMFSEKNFKPSSVKNLLFLKKKNIIKLCKMGHLIGLHSHNHPYRIANLTIKKQKLEYLKNIREISKISNFKNTLYKSIAHPSGSYDKRIFNFLRKKEIKIGFRHIMNADGGKVNLSKYEVARQDHANIIKMIKK